MDIVNREIEQYLYDLGRPKDAVLLEMERLAEPRNFPIVGPLVGRFLYQLVLISGARRVFEMGSGFGYSAYWFALALPEDGRVICTDGSSENARLAREFFARSRMEPKLEFHVGDAVEIIDKVPGEFDIIFVDIDKEKYPRAFEKALPRLKKGGLLITDNVLWHGAVVSGERDEATRGILEYTRLLYNTEGLFTSILPLRDGVSVSVKL